MCWTARRRPCSGARRARSPGAAAARFCSAPARARPRRCSPLEAAIDCPADVYRWFRGAAENPYLGYLALADSIIVTCESMSMLTEACATRKPVYMFDLHTGPESRWALLEPDRQGRHVALATPAAAALPAARLSRRLCDRPDPHDPRRAHHPPPARGATARGVLGETFPAGPPPPPLDDVARAVARVRALFDEATEAQEREMPAPHRRVRKPRPSPPNQSRGPIRRASICDHATPGVPRGMQSHSRTPAHRRPTPLWSSTRPPSDCA